jgi:hypothetical protein
LFEIAAKEKWAAKYDENQRKRGQFFTEMTKSRDNEIRGR